MRLRTCAAGFIVLIATLIPGSAAAYVGPGAGITLIGSTIALLLALASALSFVVLWPLRSLLKRRAPTKAEASSGTNEER